MTEFTARRRGATALALVLAAAMAAAPVVMADSPAPAVSAAAPLVPQQSLAPLVKAVLPAVVNISVTQKSSAEPMAEESPFPGFPQSPFDQMLRRFFDQQQGPGEHHFFFGTPNGRVEPVALGSGFIIDPKGEVVTNNHVVGDAKRVEVTLQDGSKYTAKILGRDPKTDLAVLKINADKPLPYVRFGDSSAAQIGDWVVAVGNPFGLGGTVTTGIISARGRDIHEGPFDDFLQIDAPINRGNSGGPTFNLSGQVIGINTAIYSPNGGSVGIGFAIPSNTARPIIAQLEEHGKVTRGWLGVEIQQVTKPIAASLGRQNEDGALVAAVTPDSPGAKAGLKQGDVILSFNGQEVKQLHDLPRFVAAAAPHSMATMTVWRDGAARQLQASVGEASNQETVASAGSPEEQEPGRASAVGVHFTALTNDLRRELRVGRNVEGVVVADVDDNSPVNDAGIQQGDIVVAVNQHPVRSPEDAAQRLREAAHSNAKSALLLLNRHGQTEYVGVNLTGNQG
jgi:serine protease Do